MDKLPCVGCKGMCCGPVPVTEQELRKIKKRIRTMSPKRKLELQNQTRFPGTCIFFDLDQDRCGIYLDRPEICKRFGEHKNLACIFAPELANKDEWQSKTDHVGVLSIDYTWKDFK